MPCRSPRLYNARIKTYPDGRQRSIFMNNKELTEVGKQVTKRKRPDLSEKHSVHTEPGDNRKYILFVVSSRSLCGSLMRFYALYNETTLPINKN